MLTPTKFQDLKDKVDKLKTKRERAAGALENDMAKLKELGYDDLGAAEKALTKMKADRDEAETAYEEAMTKFQERWGDLLENV